MGNSGFSNFSSSNSNPSSSSSSSSSCSSCVSPSTVQLTVTFPPNKTPIAAITGMSVNNFSTTVNMDVTLVKIGALVFMYLPSNTNTLLDSNNSGCMYESTTGIIPARFRPLTTVVYPIIQNNCGVQTVGSVVIYGQDNPSSAGTVRFFGGPNWARYRCDSTDTSLKSHGPFATSVTWLSTTN